MVVLIRFIWLLKLLELCSAILIRQAFRPVQRISWCPIGNLNTTRIVCDSKIQHSEELDHLQLITAGACSRTFAQTIMHPANTYKTILQLKERKRLKTLTKLTPQRLLRGADAQFLLSIPHGALYFYVIEVSSSDYQHYSLQMSNSLFYFVLSITDISLILQF